MRNFFKTFFAALLALVVFVLLAIGIIVALVSASSSSSKPAVANNSILFIDLNDEFKEQADENVIGSFLGDPSSDIPGMYDLVRLIEYARNDQNIKGIFLKANSNENGFASSEELRKALFDFKKSKKFVIAYGDVLSQKAYYVANVADRIYCNPMGSVEWDGYAANLVFMKGLLDKLEIEPQVFYAGKFKSATEPFRYTEMSEPNRLQTSVWLNELYAALLLKTSAARNIDTALLHSLAISGKVQSAQDALKYKLVDGLKYNDEVQTELLKRTGKKQTEEISFISPGEYAKAVNYASSGDGKIALIFASGDIVDGKGEDGQVGGDEFVRIIRKARLDKETKAIVFRVNSPGGSVLASEKIWREIALAKKQKPVVVSMGNLAASGGYYISCAADSIYASPATITGSIGVFTLIPNMEGFFNDKLGITFDAVKTAPYADMPNVTRPLSETESKFIQSSIDSIYHVFISRVSKGRGLAPAFVDSIAQGRVWTGETAATLGLVDKLGTLQNAVDCAARMARITSYRTREYPEKKTWLEEVFDNSLFASIKMKSIKNEVGEKQYNLLLQAKSVQQIIGIPQAKLPFMFNIH